MAQSQSKYSIELVNSSGTLLADLSGRAANRKVSKSRNAADQISWTINLATLEQYAIDTFQDPKNILIPGQTEIRIKRGQSYLSGGQVVYLNTVITPNAETVEIRATGFLNLFKDRYTDVERIFTGIQGTTIASTLINESQALTNGNFGITIGTLATAGTHDRTYRRDNIKDALVALTQVTTNPFDFEFTYNKVFNTYVAIGSSRPDVVFEYPGNIKSLSVPLDATGLTNEVIVLGSGFGSDAGASSTVDDTGSQLSYKLRQKILTQNSVQESATLSQAGNAELAAWAFPFELPSLEIDANISPYVTDFGIGDYVRVRIKHHTWLSHIDALYRVEKYDLLIDDNDNETIKLYLSR